MVDRIGIRCSTRIASGRKRHGEEGVCQKMIASYASADLRSNCSNEHTHTHTRNTRIRVSKCGDASLA